MWIYLAIIITGGIGASVRYFFQDKFPVQGFPWALFLINSIGSLLIGLLFAKGASSLGLEQRTLTILAAGFLGGLTTFSGFSIEIVRMMSSGNFLLATSFLLGQNLLAVFCCYLGYQAWQ